MGINIPVFEKKEIEIRETYIDEQGRTQERIKKVMVPTGKVLDQASADTASEEKPKGN